MINTVNVLLTSLPLVLLLFTTDTVSSEDKFPFEVRVTTDDGQIPESIAIRYFYRSRDGKFERQQTEYQRNEKVGRPVKLPVSTQKVVITSKGYAPAWILLKQPKVGKLVSRKVTLGKGVEYKIRVVDQNGNRVNRATVMPKAIVDGGTEINWRSRGAHPKGEATFQYPKQTQAASVRVVAPQFKQKNLELPLDGGTCEVRLESYSTCWVEVKDHKGNPVANSPVYILNNGPKFTDRERKGHRWRTDKEGKFEIKFNPDLSFFSCLLVETKDKKRGVLTNLQPIDGKTFQFQLPEPRTIKFRIKGDQSLLKGTSFEFTNGVRDKARHQYIFTVPCQFDEDQAVVTVPGVLDGWASLSLTSKKENLFWSPEIQFEPDDVEIEINLDQYKKHRRKFQIVFEHNGKRVEPRGDVTFYVRSNKSGGRTFRQKIEKGFANIEGNYNDAVNKIRVVNHGLIGYCIDGDDRVQEKLIPLNRLSRNDVQTVVVPVVPAGRISGKVQLADGKPFVGPIQIEYRSLSEEKKGVRGFKPSLYTRDGNFDLTPAPLGVEVSLRIGKFGDLMTKTIVVNEQVPSPVETITLPKTEVASVEVRLPDGQPAKGFSISFFRKSDSNISTSVRTNSKGLCEVPLALHCKEDYCYRVRPKSGFQTVMNTAIKPGEKVIVKLKEGLQLSGRVTNEKGKPVPQMIVQAMNEDGKMIESTVTKRDGSFELTRLSDRPVKLKARHITHDVKVELTSPIKAGTGKKVELKAIDKRKMIGA